MGDDDGDVGFGASGFFKELFVCSQSGIHTCRKLPYWRQLWQLFGNILIRKFGYRPDSKYKSYFKG